MSLEAKIREQIRLSILRYSLSEASAGLLKQYLRAEGFRVDDAEVDFEIGYLVDKGLLKQMPKRISPEIRHYLISAEGRDFLAESGNEK